MRLGDVSAPETSGNFSKSFPGGERVQPDVAQPPLHEQQQFGALAAIFGLDGGGQFILPFFAQIFFDLVVFFERRTGGQGFIHARTDFAEFLEQRVEQTVAAEQTFLLGGGAQLNFSSQSACVGFERPRAFAGKIQAQAAG